MGSPFVWISRKGKVDRDKALRLFSLCARPQSAEQVHAWVSRHLPEGMKPSIRRPFNYARFATITTLILGGVSIITVAGPYVLPIVQNRNLWAAVSLITVLLFTSGQMFNHIRKVPYVAGDGRGGINYFAGGFSNQWGMETQIVAAMCKYCASFHLDRANSSQTAYLPLLLYHLPLRYPELRTRSNSSWLSSYGVVSCWACTASS